MSEKKEYMAGSVGSKGAINSFYGWVYGRALTDEEVESIYNSEVPSEQVGDVELDIGGAILVKGISERDDLDEVRFKNGSVLRVDGEADDLKIVELKDFSIGVEKPHSSHLNSRCIFMGDEKNYSEENGEVDESMIDRPP